MDRNWVSQKLAEREVEKVKRKEKIRSFILNSPVISEDDKATFVEELERVLEFRNHFMLDTKLKLYPIPNESEAECEEWLASIDALQIDQFYYDSILSDDWMIERYLDSEPMEFDGDIIITDPCYVIREDQFTDDDWEYCGYGRRMELLGFSKYMTRDTIYGDWSCTTFDSDTGDAIGSFCADSGTVSVLLLDDILKYNPDYHDHTDDFGAATLIRNFKGTVQFVVTRTEGVYESTTEYHMAGETWEEYNVLVIGHGVDKVTGEPMNFVGRQTGF